MPIAEKDPLLQVYAQFPFEPASAEGVVLRTTDGREIVDFYGGHAVASLGYAHPRLVEALASQAKTLTFQSNAVALEVRTRAARRLTAFAPEGLEQVFFANSGAEANENALRLAFRATRRERVVAVEHAFHGRTAAAGAVTWGAADKWYAFPRAPFPVSFVPRNEPEALEALVDETTAAVIAEPIQGVAGAFALDPDFVRAMRRLCDSHGAVLIFDEVQSGVGRTGQPFAADLFGVTPDILTTAKSLAAGFPIGAVLMNEAVASSVTVGDLGTTFGGGPMAAALVETVLDVIEEEGLLGNVRRLSALIRSTCQVGPVEAIQGAGFLTGLRCRRPAKEVRDALLDQGILVGTSADASIVRLLPPLVLGEEHVEMLSKALASLPL